MAISILNNPASLAAQNALGITNTNLQKALYQLSSGSRINTGADDAAGLAVADGLMANITALTQSARNASDGVGKLQVADGALAQVTTLLNPGVFWFARLLAIADSAVDSAVRPESGIEKFGIRRNSFHGSDVLLVNGRPCRRRRSESG